MDIFEGKNKRYCKRLTKFGRNIVLRIKPRAAMFVVRSANLSLARYLTNPRVIAWLPALKSPLEPRLLTEILLFWASLKRRWRHFRKFCAFARFFCRDVIMAWIIGSAKSDALTSPSCTTRWWQRGNRWLKWSRLRKKPILVAFVLSVWIRTRGILQD